MQVLWPVRCFHQTVEKSANIGRRCWNLIKAPDDFPPRKFRPKKSASERFYFSHCSLGLAQWLLMTYEIEDAEYENLDEAGFMNRSSAGLHFDLPARFSPPIR